MSERTLKPRILQLLKRAHQDVSDIWDGLPAADRAQVGQPDRWAAKDLLAHLAGWNGRMNRRMANMPDGDSPNELEALDRINAVLFAANRTRTWQELRDEGYIGTALDPAEEGGLDDRRWVVGIERVDDTGDHVAIRSGRLGQRYARPNCHTSIRAQCKKQRGHHNELTCCHSQG